MSAIPIRVRLTLAFAIAMACVIGAMALLVYVRVGSALLASVDQTLHAQSQEALAHTRDEHGTLDTVDATGGRTLAQVLGAGGAITRSTPAGLPPLLQKADAARVLHGAKIYRSERLHKPDGHWRVLAVPTPDGRAVVVARSLEPREETLNRIYREFLIAGPLAILLASLAGYGLAAAALRPVEALRRRADSITPALPATLPVPRARDEISRLAITLNHMLERLQAAIEHERRFVADASHELRTPVALLRTELELALRRPRSEDELKRALRSALEETERLSRLADALLLLARAEQGPMPVRKEHVELGPLLETVARRFLARGEQAGRAVRAEPTSLTVDADPTRIRQALDNLVDNALTYGEGDVTLLARDEGAAIEVHVVDDGAGFDEAFLARAFDRFSRADEARGRGGAGLGLSIVELIAEAHGGTAGARNLEGGGADVWIAIAKRES
jgi:two-component system OmpR family sensor kinase